MKKIILLILSAVLLISLTGCRPHLLLPAAAFVAGAAVVA